MTPSLDPMALLVVAAGGAAGSLARYLTAVWLQPMTGVLPWATLLVNVVGAFLIGAVARLVDGPAADPLWRLALATGFCGGFTTFSALSAETVQLLQQGKVGRAVLYPVLSLVLGLAATAAGLSLGGTTRPPT